MFSPFSRLLAILLILAPTSLSASQSFAGQNSGVRYKNAQGLASHSKHRVRSRGYRVSAGKYRHKRSHQRGHSRSSFVIALGRQETPRSYRRSEPLVLHPVSRITKVSAKQLRIGRSRAQARSERSETSNGRGWSVVSRSSFINAPLRVEFEAPLVPVVESVVDEAIAEEIVDIVESNDTLVEDSAVEVEASAQLANDHDPLVVYFND